MKEFVKEWESAGKQSNKSEPLLLSFLGNILFFLKIFRVSRN